MRIEFLEQIPSLLPLDFFSISAHMHYGTSSALRNRKKRSHFLLSDTCELLREEKFADVALCWSEEGIFIEVSVDKPCEEVLFPFFSKGDAIELFFDTRDLKTTGFSTRFCHHFIFLPKTIQNIQAQEMTHFRTEDTHPLCDPHDLSVDVKEQKNAYTVGIFIPAHCLHGYDPYICDRMGFTYRIHRYGGVPQHFTISSKDFTLEQSPRLWGSLTMIK